MRMLEFRVDKKDRICTLSGTGGYQGKYSCGDKFVKVQARIGGYYVDDWMVEIAASKLGKQLGINIVEQKPCLVFEGKTQISRFGVASDNFESPDVHFISLKRICGDEWPDTRYNRLNIYDKMRYIATAVESATGIQASRYMTYLLDTAIIDILVCNVDRHFRNLGLMYNNKENKYYIPAIFDCGMGLFVQEPELIEMTHGDLSDMIDRCYIEPYSESPIDLADYITKHPVCSVYLNILKSRLGKRGLVALKNWFPSIQSYEYFRFIRKKLMFSA